MEEEQERELSAAYMCIISLMNKAEVNQVTISNEDVEDACKALRQAERRVLVEIHDNGITIKFCREAEMPKFSPVLDDMPRTENDTLQ